MCSLDDPLVFEVADIPADKKYVKTNNAYLQGSWEGTVRTATAYGLDKRGTAVLVLLGLRIFIK
jgi:hypothetical protein